MKTKLCKFEFPPKQENSSQHFRAPSPVHTEELPQFFVLGKSLKK
jgi:hypothetical protein